MAKKNTTLQMTLGDESSGSCSSRTQVVEAGARKDGKMVVAGLPQCQATVRVDNRDPCRSRMVLTMDDMSISMEQSTCPSTRGSSVTTLCVQTARARDSCPHRPPRTVLETQIVVRK